MIRDFVSCLFLFRFLFFLCYDVFFQSSFQGFDVGLPRNQISTMNVNVNLYKERSKIYAVLRIAIRFAF